MAVFPLVLFLLAFAYWLYAERHEGLRPRVISGLTCIALASVGVYALAMFGRQIATTLQESSMRKMGKLIEQGDVMRVQKAVQAYNRVAATDSPDRAAKEMWHVLNDGPRP